MASVSSGGPRSGADSARDDELIRLQQVCRRASLFFRPRAAALTRHAPRSQENAALKKSNLTQSENVKKLGVQLTRIRNDWQSQAAPKDLAPVAKARAAADVSKSDKISELQVELSQRDAREERLQQQITLLRQLSLIHI